MTAGLNMSRGRTAAALGALLSLVLAGCTSSSHSAVTTTRSSSQTRSPRTTLSATSTPAAEKPPAGLSCKQAVEYGPNRSDDKASTAQGCWFPTGFKDISPSIQISNAGVLFIARGKGGLLRSTTGGRTWSSVPVPKLANGDSHDVGVHGYVYLDPRTDRVFYLTSAAAASCGGHSGGVISWSDDLGKTWAGKTVGCDTYDWGKLVTGPAPKGNKYPSAIYFLGVGGHVISGQRYVYRSLDGGVTWQRMKNIASATTEGGAGVTASDGTIYFDYPEFTGLDPTSLTDKIYPYVAANKCRQMVAVSEDYGETWRQEPVPGSQACGLINGDQRVAVDKNGTVYVVWIDDRDSQLYLSSSTDHAHTWSPGANVTAPGFKLALMVDNIVAGAAGHVLIAALQTTAAKRPPSPAGYPGVWLPGPYTAHATLTESQNANTARPTFTTVDLDAGGDPTLKAGQNSNEINGYLAMSPTGQGWAVFSRHTTGGMIPGDIWAARFYPG